MTPEVTANQAAEERRVAFACELVRRTLESQGQDTSGVEMLAVGMRVGRFGLEPCPDPLQQPRRWYPNLTARPWWEPDEFEWVPALESAYPVIRKEILGVMQEDGFSLNPDSGVLTDAGAWREFRLYSKGRRHYDGIDRCPRTTAAIEAVPGTTTAGSVFFAATDPGTHIVPHFAPHNARLRVHLGLVVPPGNEMRVGTESRPWQEGRCVVFDDSFEHETWNCSDRLRVILLFDIWHPEVTPAQMLAIRYSEAPMLANACDMLLKAAGNESLADAGAV